MSAARPIRMRGPVRSRDDVPEPPGPGAPVVVKVASAPSVVPPKLLPTSL
jgi:hypothetical protein